MANIGDYVDKSESEGLPELEAMQQAERATEEAPEAAGGGIGIDLSFLKAKTGEGSIEDYIDHPLNWNSSRPVAQILRGFTGLFGSMEYALVDIMIGAFRLSKARKDVVSAS